MITREPRKIFSVVFFTIAVMMGCMNVSTPALAKEKTSSETLCVLDFNRLGDDQSMDWLKRGLSDMMIHLMHRLSPYQLINRQDLTAILKEHQLAESGLAEMEKALTQARLAQARYLLLGNFVIQEKRLTIQVRMIDVNDQSVLAMVTWEGESTDALKAPESITKDLLASLKKPFDPQNLQGIEKLFPRNIPTAEAFYNGQEAFDNGEYAASLAHYLDGEKNAGGFLRIYDEIVKLYHRLQMPEHSVLFAEQVGERLAQDDLSHALEFYYIAAQYARDTLKNPALTVYLLEKLIRLAEEDDKKTGARQAIVEAVKVRAKQLYSKPGFNERSSYISEPDLDYRIWMTKFSDLRSMSDLGEVYLAYSFEDGQYKQTPIPEPNVFMWKTRAQYELARFLTEQGQAQRVVQLYSAIFDDYKFLEDYSFITLSKTHSYFVNRIKTEAYISLLILYRKTGQLIRDPKFMPKTIEVTDGYKFKRSFKDNNLDPRAKDAWLLKDQRSGREQYDFAAPAGFQIDKVTLHTKVNGYANFEFTLPNPRGNYPFNYKLADYLKEFDYFPGNHHENVDFPPGEEMVMLAVMWGTNGTWPLKSKVAASMAQLVNKRDLDEWELTFEVSPRQVKIPTTIVQNFERDDRATLSDYFTRYHWKEGQVHHEEQSFSYTGEPKMDVYAQEWLVFSNAADIQIRHQANPSMRIDLPPSINSMEDEFNPTLVKTLEGGWALFFTRAVKGQKNITGYFYSTTMDMIHWENPKRMQFEDPDEIWKDLGFNPIPAERTFNIIPLVDKYLMLLEFGFVRYSQDLQNWGKPVKMFDHNGTGYRSSLLVNDRMWHDATRSSIIKSRDESIWVITTFDKKVEPSAESAGAEPWRFWKEGDKKFINSEAIKITSSVDGVNWTKEKLIYVSKYEETLGHWAFPLGRDKMVVVVMDYGFNLKFIVAQSPEHIEFKNSPVGVYISDKEVQFFEQDQKINLVQPAIFKSGNGWMFAHVQSARAYQEMMK